MKKILFLILTILGTLIVVLIFAGMYLSSNRDSDDRVVTVPATNTPTTIPPLPTSCTGTPQVYAVAPPLGGTGDDGPAIQAKINQAISDIQTGVTNSAEIQLQAGATYRLGARADRYDVLDFRTQDLSKPDIHCINFNGQNAKLAISPVATGLYVGRCIDCVFHTFKITAWEKAGTQGKVTAVHVPTSATDAGYVDVKIHPDFPVFDVPVGYINSKVVEPGLPLGAVFFIYEPNLFVNHLTNDFGMTGGHPIPPQVLVESSTVLDPSQRTMRVFFDGSNDTRNVLAKLQVGRAVVSIVKLFPDKARRDHLDDVWKTTWSKEWSKHPEFSQEFFIGNAGRAFNMQMSSNVLIQNVTISNYSGGGMLFSGNMGPFTLDGVKIVPEADGHLNTVASDGIHGSNNRVGPIIRNSRIENVDDDGINMTTTAYYAATISANRKIAELKSNKSPSPILPGDTFGLYDGDDNAKKGEFVVASTTLIAPLHYLVEFTTPLPSGIALGCIIAPCSAIPDPDTFVNYNMANAGELIEDNLFLNVMRNGVIIRSSGIIRNNVFLTVGNAAVQYSHAINRDINPPRGETGDDKEVIIEGNTVVDTNDGLLRIGTGVPPGKTVTTEPLIVRNNKVLGPRDRVVSRPIDRMTTAINASNNTIYTSGTQTHANMVKDTLWPTASPFAIVRETPAQLLTRKLAVGLALSPPIAPLSAQLIQSFFFGD